MVLAGAEGAASLELAPARLLSFREVRPPRGSLMPFNPSGLLRWKDSWLVVSDKKNFPNIYRLRPEDGGFVAEPFLPLKPQEALGAQDLEGLAFCGGRFLIPEEATGSIVEVDAQGAASLRPIDFLEIHKERGFAPALGTKGAGLEAVACEENGPVYVANERQYRMIYVLDPKTLRPVDFFDVPAGWSAPRFIGTTPVYPDFADLFFENGFLYALQRNDRLVLKIDPKTKALLAVLPLKFDEKDYYDYAEPFGMAEGLALTKDRIYVLLDNNATQRKGRLGDFSSLLLEFKRPPKF